MVNKDCLAYNANMETVKKLVGYSSNGPIYVENDLVVTEYCDILKSYDFDCTNCKYAEAFKKDKKSD